MKPSFGKHVSQRKHFFCGFCIMFTGHKYLHLTNYFKKLDLTILFIYLKIIFTIIFFVFSFQILIISGI